jgi:hypothetical protein
MQFVWLICLSIEQEQYLSQSFQLNQRRGLRLSAIDTSVRIDNKHSVHHLHQHNNATMNTTRAISRATPLLRSTITRNTQSRLAPTLRSQLRNNSTSHAPTSASPLMKPVLWTVGAGVIGGVGYGLTRSSGCIGGRFEDREKRLDRQKWLKEGAGVDDKWLR